MAWVKIDDEFFLHRKIVSLSHAAIALHLSSMCLVSKQETDGRLNRQQLQQAAGLARTSPTKARELVAAGVWHEIEGGYEIHDYLAYNPSADELAARREATKDRVSAFRQKRRQGTGNAVTPGVTPPVTGVRGGEARNAVANASIPYPLSPERESSSSLTSVEAPPGEEEDRRIREAIEVAAAARCERQRRKGVDIPRPEAWTAKAAENLRREGASKHAASILDAFPSTTVDELAKHIDQGSTPRRALCGLCTNGLVELAGGMAKCTCQGGKADPTMSVAS